MDRDSRNVKKPAMDTREQIDREKLTEEEKEVRKEVHNVLQSELAKLLAEEERGSRELQGGVQRDKATEKSKEGKRSLTLQNEVEKATTKSKEDTERASPQSEIGKATAKGMSKAEMEPSSSQSEEGKATAKGLSKADKERASSQGEVRKALPKTMLKAETEPFSSWGEDENATAKGKSYKKGKRRVSLQEEALILRKEEEDTLKDTERDAETLDEKESESSQAEGGESSRKVKGEQGSLLSHGEVADDEEDEDEVEKERPSSTASLWSKHKEKIKVAAIIEKPLEQLGPPGYFAKLTRKIMMDLSVLQSTKAPEGAEKYKRKNMPPRLAKMLNSEPTSRQKLKLKKQLSLKESRLSQILSQEFSEGEEVIQDTEEPEDLRTSSTKSTVVSDTSPEQNEKAARAAKDQSPKGESLYSYPGGSSVWNMGQRISHWKMAHQRGYQVGQLTQDKIYKQKLLKHERDTKIAMPLPLQEVMEEEVFAILMETLFDYHSKLGSEHPLTIQMEQQVEQLHLQLQGRRVI